MERERLELRESVNASLRTSPSSIADITRTSDSADFQSSSEQDRSQSEVALGGALKRWGDKHDSKSHTLGQGKGLYSSLSYDELRSQFGDGNSEDDALMQTAADTMKSKRSRTSLLDRLSPGFSQRLARAVRHSLGTLTGLPGRRKSSQSTESARYTPGSAYDSQREEMSDEEPMFDGEFNANFQKQIADNMHFEGRSRKQAIVQARVQRMVKEYGTAERAVFKIIEDCRNQDEGVAMLRVLLSDGLDLSCAKHRVHGTPVHCAVHRRFPGIVKLLVDSKAPLDGVDSQGCLAVEIALNKRFDDVASILLLAMEKPLVRSLFECRKPALAPRINFNMILHESKLKRSSEVILDSMIEPCDSSDQYLFHFAILEADNDGITPESQMFESNSHTNYHHILDCKDFSKHQAVRMLTHQKWKKFGQRWAMQSIVVYIFFVFCVSFALISAGTQRNEDFDPVTRELGDPRQYNTAESYVRAICEIIVVIGLLYSLSEEAIELKSRGRAYFHDGYNLFQLSLASMMIAVIPLRWINNDAQWYIAAVAYIFILLRVLRLISITRFVGIYLRILTRIIISDMSRFAVIFSIYWFMFTGSFFLVLTGSERRNATGAVVGTQLSIADNAGSYSNILFSGLRSMVEGDAIIDYADQGYHSLAVIIMMLFLFFTLVVLLNILIAQLSDTYADVKASATFTLEHNWGQMIRFLEQTDKFKDLRRRTYRDAEMIENPEDILIIWTAPVVANEQREVEQKQNVIEMQLNTQEQTLQSIKAQMRNITEILGRGEGFQNNFRDLLKDMVGERIPQVMEEVVGRNTKSAVKEMGNTSIKSAHQMQAKLKEEVVAEVTQLISNATEEITQHFLAMLAEVPPI